MDGADEQALTLSGTNAPQWGWFLEDADSVHPYIFQPTADLNMLSLYK